MRGFTFGYVSEYKLRKSLLNDPRIERVRKPDDHDRSIKCDLLVASRGRELKLEVKSLQTNSIRKTENGFEAKFQCDASDRRTAKLPNGRKVETTCLVTDEFDILAVCLFEFEQEWHFAFARNTDLPRTESPKYTPAQRKYLLATLMAVTWPLKAPFELDPLLLLDQIAS